MYKFLLIQYQLGRITKEQFDALAKDFVGDDIDHDTM